MPIDTNVTTKKVYKLTEDGKLMYDMFLRTEGSEDFVHHLHCELEKQPDLAS